MNSGTSASVFITGGASGLGKAIAQRYAKAGYRVAIADTNTASASKVASSLHELGASDAMSINRDVTREADFEAAAATLKAAWGAVDIVVNNVGMAAAGRVEDFSLDDWREVLELNLISVVASSKVFTPLFREQGAGHFVNIASLTGLVAAPLMSAYTASKAAVMAMSESLRLELNADNIKISVVCPSYFPSKQSTRMPSTQPTLVKAVNTFMQASELTPADIAGDIYDGVCGNEFLILPHAHGKRALRMKRMLPDRLWLRYMLTRTAKLIKLAG